MQMGVSWGGMVWVRRWCLAGALVVLGGLLSACGPQPSVLIGFVGGLTDRNADNGQAGQNGVILAVEQFNRNGGLGGRMVQLISHDDAQNPATPARAAQPLVRAGVEAAIAPFTSSMAEATVPVSTRPAIFQISPTITSLAFHGQDDHLFRINRTTRDNARDYARIVAARGQRRVTVAYDLRNRSFTESWLKEFRLHLERSGARVVAAVPYDSQPDTRFDTVVADMLKARPDGLFFISGALDVARLAQQARKQAPQLPMGASEWASTEQLLELGGAVVEGLLIAQNYNHEDHSARFRDFTDAYIKRFQRNPGYSSVSAYDATTVLLTALQQRREGESLKAAALRSGPYPGLQQTITFDANGDTERRVFFAEVRGGDYVLLQPPKAEPQHPSPAAPR